MKNEKVTLTAAVVAKAAVLSTMHNRAVTTTEVLDAIGLTGKPRVAAAQSLAQAVAKKGSGLIRTSTGRFLTMTLAKGATPETAALGTDGGGAVERAVRAVSTLGAFGGDVGTAEVIAFLGSSWGADASRTGALLNSAVASGSIVKTGRGRFAATQTI